MSPFRPVLYLKDTCPHCLKLRIFLLESGLLGRFDQRIFAQGDDAEAAIREELGQQFENVTFPAVQYAPDVYMKESDAIIEHYGEEAGIARCDLPVFTAYAGGLLPRYMDARRELRTFMQLG